MGNDVETVGVGVTRAVDGADVILEWLLVSLRWRNRAAGLTEHYLFELALEAELVETAERSFAGRHIGIGDRCLWVEGIGYRLWSGSHGASQDNVELG